jgi:DinB superfamily
MNSLFSKEHTEALIERIQRLTPEHKPQWGNMNVSQMIAHCSSTMEVVRDQKQLKRVFIGYLFGGLLKKQFYNDAPFKKNGPTHPYFIQSDTHELEAEKKQLIQHLRSFQEGGAAKCTQQPHAFFGKLTAEQWAIGMYKHTSHHLEQFGV